MIFVSLFPHCIRWELVNVYKFQEPLTFVGNSNSWVWLVFHKLTSAGIIGTSQPSILNFSPSSRTSLLGRRFTVGAIVEEVRVVLVLSVRVILSGSWTVGRAITWGKKIWAENVARTYITTKRHSIMLYGCICNKIKTLNGIRQLWTWITIQIYQSKL